MLYIPKEKLHASEYKKCQHSLLTFFLSEPGHCSRNSTCCYIRATSSVQVCPEIVKIWSMAEKINGQAGYSLARLDLCWQFPGMIGLTRPRSFASNVDAGSSPLGRLNISSLSSSGRDASNQATQSIVCGLYEPQV